MARKRRRIPGPALPPPGLRPPLKRSTITALGVNHLQLVDDIAKGRGTEGTLWEMVEAVLCWCRVADQLEAGIPEMRVQLDMVTRVVERFGRTGIVGFSGVDYQEAKDGVDAMDQLAERVDHYTAKAAADWAEARAAHMSELVVASHQRPQQAATTTCRTPTP